MSKRIRDRRNVFLLFLGAAFVALIAALPIVTAQTQPEPKREAPQPAASGSSAPTPSDRPSFAQADRNKDGVVDKSEAGVVSGLSANFERADRNRDGRLDQAEFERGLQILQVRR